MCKKIIQTILKFPQTFLLINVFIGLAFSARSDEIPWKNSFLLYTHSEPALLSNKVIAFAKYPGVLAILTDAGVTTFLWEEKKWKIGPVLKMADIVGIAWANQRYLVAMSYNGASIIDMRTNRVSNVSDIKAVRGGINAVGCITGQGDVLVLAGKQGTILDASTGMVKQLGAIAPSALGNAFMAHAGLKNQLYILINGKLFEWDRQSNKIMEWKDRNNKQLEDTSARWLSIHPSRHLAYIGTHENGILIVDLENKKVISKAKNDVGGSVAWTAAIDPRRDVIYIPNWEYVAGFYPATNPKSWHVNSYLTSFTAPFLYAYRSVAPSAGATYLQESDELIFGGSLGVTVLSANSQSSLVMNVMADNIDLKPHTFLLHFDA